MEEMALESTLHRLFCQRLRGLRKAAGLTQAVMAERMGITQSSYSELENGAFCPSLGVVERAAQALGKPPEELLSTRKLAATA
jgi:transcriptional regulator with XRE-family HTH domain